VILRRVAHVMEVVALVAAVVFVLALFVNEPSNQSSGTDTGASAGAPDGAAIFAARCAGCHGGDGGGGSGPQLSEGHAVAAYPDAADEISLVSNGRGAMPAWEGRLTSEEIAAVVEYTRTGLPG
jgi:mono/diheme cytochrome c family protein